MPGNAIYAALLGAALILYLLECRADWHLLSQNNARVQGSIMGDLDGGHSGRNRRSNVGAEG
jgi:hypothetical protein